MTHEIIVSAANVERAIEKALEQLQMDRDSVSVEVLEMGSKGFLGIGARDARIRVTYETPDAPAAAPAEKTEKPARPAAPKAEKPAAPAEKEEKPAAPARPRDEKPRLVKAAPHTGEAPAPVRPVEKKDAGEKPRLVKAADPAEAQSLREQVEREAATERAERPARAERPRRERRRPAEEKVEKVEKPEKIEHPYVPANPLPEEQVTADARRAADFVAGLIEKMGIEGKVVITDQTEYDHVRLEIQGDNMGAVIGRRGDTLDAIQYLTSLVLNREAEDHIRLTIDTENYRIKRADSLERLARKMAGKVVRYHKPMTLEPMNPYERRIIHAALQEYRGVTTHSTGTEPNRRVVISPEGRRPRPSAK